VKLGAQTRGALPRSRLLPLALLFACLNPQPDEHPLYSGSSPPGGLAADSPASAPQPSETQPVFSDDADSSGPEQPPSAPVPSEPSAGANADAGPPADAGAGDAGGSEPEPEPL
jgi:hypothetical protein